VAGAEVVITMLPSGRHVLDVLAARALPFAPGALVIDCSTIDVASCATFHESLQAKGLATLDAPVSGGVGGAAAGTLTIMAGGTEAAFARALEFLRAMGKNIIHAGAAGAGQAAKICNNMMPSTWQSNWASILGSSSRSPRPPRASAGPSRAMHPSPAWCRLPRPIGVTRAASRPS
jgi:3-hydroxyisobutyrate dehydrogenase-like beta-hydroxyacid dehydrogenase